MIYQTNNNIEKMIDFFLRLDKFMEYKGLNDNKISVNCGISNGLIGKARKKGGALSLENISKILNSYPDLNSDWLITGRGEMLCINNDISHVSYESYSKEQMHEQQEVPLYDISAAAGCVMLFQDSNNMVPIDTIKIPNLAKCDGAVFARGDSMYPIIKSGDIILYKVMQGLDTIIWGETYIVTYESYGDYYTVVKYVKRSTEHDGNLVLLSQNEHHQPFEIHISQVKSMALVRASVRYNNM